MGLAYLRYFIKLCTQLTKRKASEDAEFIPFHLQFRAYTYFDSFKHSLERNNWCNFHVMKFR